MHRRVSVFIFRQVKLSFTIQSKYAELFRAGLKTTRLAPRGLPCGPGGTTLVTLEGIFNTGLGGQKVVCIVLL